MSRDPNNEPDARIFFCSSDRVEELKGEVDKILTVLLGHTRALVTDQSSVGDFMPSQAALGALGELVGEAIDEGDALWRLAVKVRVRQSQANLASPAPDA